MELVSEGKNFRLARQEELPEILEFLEKHLPESLKAIESCGTVRIREFTDILYRPIYAGILNQDLELSMQTRYRLSFTLSAVREVFHQTLKTFLNDRVWDFYFYVNKSWPEEPVCLHFPGMTLSNVLCHPKISSGYQQLRHSQLVAGLWLPWQPLVIMKVVDVDLYHDIVMASRLDRRYAAGHDCMFGGLAISGALKTTVLTANGDFMQHRGTCLHGWWPRKSRDN
uniref:Uncharacterized protein n=1 Tax=Timema tahoe TaxID=61484 RepID=A0A7R9FF83_9NEOP|nr:unnamed protein product [Timema tahoe]